MWDVASRLMVLYGKTFPCNDGAKAAYWYRMAAEAADRGGDLRTRVRSYGWRPRVERSGRRAGRPASV